MTYDLTYPNATFGTLHAWVGSDLFILPKNKQGIPVPGQFCNAMGGVCQDATGLTTRTLTIPFFSIGVVDVTSQCVVSLFTLWPMQRLWFPMAIGLSVLRRHWVGVQLVLDHDGGFCGSYQVCCDFGDPPVCMRQPLPREDGYGQRNRKVIQKSLLRSSWPKIVGVEQSAEVIQAFLQGRYFPPGDKWNSFLVRVKVTKVISYNGRWTMNKKDNTQFIIHRLTFIVPKWNEHPYCYLLTIDFIPLKWSSTVVPHTNHMPTESAFLIQDSSEGLVGMGVPPAPSWSHSSGLISQNGFFCCFEIDGHQYPL